MHIADRIHNRAGFEFLSLRISADIETSLRISKNICF